MKKTIIMLLVVCKLFASNDQNNTALDMFLFKIGFQSLVNELENEKKLTQENRNMIHDLKNQLNEMSDIKSNSKLLNNTAHSITNNHINKQEISNLKTKIDILEKKLNEFLNKTTYDSIHKNKTIQKQIANIKKDNTQNDYINTVVIVKKSNVFSKKNNKSSVKFSVLKGDILKIKSCDKFSWCEVYNQQAYIAKYKLKF